MHYLPDQPRLHTDAFMPTKPPAVFKHCKECGANFRPKRDWQVFCTKACQQGFHWGRKQLASKEAAMTPRTALGDIPDERLSRRLQLFVRVSTANQSGQTHCSWCGRTLPDMPEHRGFCNMACLKHFLFDKKPNAEGMLAQLDNNDETNPFI